MLDLLIEEGVEVTKIFAPEHGFRGNIDRGKHFDNTIDKKTGIPIIAMFGKNRKPTPEQLSNNFENVKSFYIFCSSEKSVKTKEN